MCSIKEAVSNNSRRISKTHRKTPVSESLFDKKETPTQVFFCEFCDVFTNIVFYRAPPVAVSRLNLSNFWNLNPNSGRSLFINYINPIEPWGPKPNNKIIISITGSLSFELELPKAYSKDKLRKKKCHPKCLLKCEGKIWIFIKILRRFW